MQVQEWVSRIKLEIFLFQLLIWMGTMVLLQIAAHVLFGHRVDWFFTVLWGLAMAATYTWVPPMKWPLLRPRKR